MILPLLLFNLSFFSSPFNSHNSHFFPFGRLSSLVASLCIFSPKYICIPASLLLPVIVFVVCFLARSAAFRLVPTPAEDPCGCTRSIPICVPFLPRVPQPISWV